MSSEIFKTNNNETLVKRMVEWLDLEAMHNLAASENYDCGLHNFQLYYETSPQSWTLVANEKGEVVAYNTFNHLMYGNVRHGFQLLVRKDYRGTGITKAINAMHYSNFPSIGNASSDSLLRYKFQKFGEKLLGYKGLVTDCNIVKPSKSANVAISSLDHSKLETFLVYDKSILGFERKKFIIEWAMPLRYPCKATTSVAERNNIVCGYGTIRECSGYMTISPLYADNDIIAEWLLYDLIKDLPKGNQIYIYFLANNHLLMKWVHKLNFIRIDCELRNYIGDVPKNDAWDMKRVYGLHDYYPV